jgi:predicted chitinase
MRLRELFEHKKGIRAKKYNKKPKKFIEPIKPKKAEAPHTTEDLDEGWKTKVAGAAMAAANMLGTPAHANDVEYKLPDIVAHITMTVNGKTIEKEINLGTEYQSPAEAEKAVAKWLKEKGIKSYRIDLQRANTNEGWKDWVAGAALGAASLGASAGNVVYQPAERGDTVYSIARQNGVSPQEIMKLNHFNKDTKLVKGQKVKVPDNAKEIPVAKKVDKNPEVKKSEPKTVSSSSNAHENLAIKAATAAGIKGIELAQFMAQLKHESADFAHMKEIGGGLDFKKYDPKFAPKKAKVLGNTQVGDGARYKGRGFIQITGRDNYRMAGEALGLPLEAKPELAANPEIAAKIAVWYWNTRVKPDVSNFNDTAAVTKKINPGLRGLADRLSHFKDYKSILNIKA